MTLTRRKNTTAAFLFLLPAFGLLFVFKLYPIVSTFILSFNSVNFNGRGIDLLLLGAGDQITRNVVTRNTIIDCRVVGPGATFSKNTCGTEIPAGVWD